MIEPGHAPECERPDPRILEKNGRQYCNTCRRYLDVPPGDDPSRHVAEPKKKESHE